MKWKINIDLLLLKSLYFFELSVVACLFIYLAPFMSEWGITATEFAVINFIAHIVAFILRPFFGFWADKYQKYKEIIGILAFSCCFINSIQLVIPKYKYRTNDKIAFAYSIENHTQIDQLNLCYFANVSVFTCCDVNPNEINLLKTSLTATNISCNDNLKIHRFNTPILINNVSTISCKNMANNCSYIQSNLSRNIGFTWSVTFWVFLIVKVVAHSMFSALLSLTDAVTFVILTKEKCHKFGFTRMFGTIGILVFSILTALILFAADWVNKAYQWSWIKNILSFSQFAPCFALALPMFLTVMLLSLFLRSDKPIHSEQFWKSFNWLYKDWEIFVFFIFSILGGFIFTILIEYYFLIIYQMFRELPKYFPGLVFSVMTISETVFIGASPFILKFMNDEFWITFSFCIWSIRGFSYMFVSNYWMLIIIELLTNGPAFGLMLPCMMSHISKFADKTSQGRMQCLFSGLYFNIGGACGGLYGGIVLDKFGYNGVFASIGVLSLICGITYYPLQRMIIPRLCKQTVPHEYSSTEKEIPLLELENKIVLV